MYARNLKMADWVTCLDKRPIERNPEDIDIIYSRLKNVKAFERFHPLLLQQICYHGYYEDLEPGVVLFCQGDTGTNWYAVLSGSLEVCVSETGDEKDSVTVCTLGGGTSFGESVLTDTPRQSTVVTVDFCELLRIEKKDFKMLWERNKQFMEGVMINVDLMKHPKKHQLLQRKKTLAQQIELAESPAKHVQLEIKESNVQENKNLPTSCCELNHIVPITETPSEQITRAEFVLRSIISTRYSHMIRDRKYHLRTYRRCMVGTEMVDWMMQHSNIVQSRVQATGMWQALLEEGTLMHVSREHHFKDKYLFYRFHEDEMEVGGSVPSHSEKKECENELPEILIMLSRIGPDAHMRTTLRKPSQERSVEDLEMIYEDLLHVKALSHLSNMVKRELCAVIKFEAHGKAGKTLFNQGDEGRSWYIILKGSVNVVIFGKGIVCTLHEGDDFGKLALLNDTARAASIILREENCHFLRVDKDDFNRILRDVEANTVRLKEHGHDVLVLEKISLKRKDKEIENSSGKYKYSVMAGTPEKMLEHLLESHMDQADSSDQFVKDFLITHVLFMPPGQLCQSLMEYYHSEPPVCQEKEAAEILVASKKRVVSFVVKWSTAAKEAFKEDEIIKSFLETLHAALLEDYKKFPFLKHDVATVEQMIKTSIASKQANSRKIKPSLSKLTDLMHHSQDDKDYSRKMLKPNDQKIFKVYCEDHTYTTLQLPLEASASDIIQHAADKLCLSGDIVLCEVRSSGDKVIINDDEVSVPTGLSVNGRLFISPREHIESLLPLPEQEGPKEGTEPILDLMSSRDLAYQMTVYDWELFTCLHEHELLYHCFGREKFGKITSNFDLFLRRFNEVQYWIISELCLTQNLNKRVQLVRKFIKLAGHLKEYQNLNSFCAVVMGLTSVPISRLTQTWEKLPSKFRKTVSEYENIMEPSHNHRVYRLIISKMNSPIIPFMPLLMKDMAFTNDGNKTNFDGLVNFEKMHMIASTIHHMNKCRSKNFAIEVQLNVKHVHDVANYVREINVIDNQRKLMNMSHKLEPKI